MTAPQPKLSRPAHVLNRPAIVLGLLVANLYGTGALAQADTASTPPSNVSVHSAAKTASPPVLPSAPKSEAKPVWKDLSAEQQKALKPLGASWSGIGEAQKRKWLAVSKNYAMLSPPEQAKLHSRMTDWVALSPQQRNQARLNFAETKGLSPSEKSANWAAYQALSPQEKQKLAAQGGNKPVGASSTVKPVPSQKLASVPVTRQQKRPDGQHAVNSAANPLAVDQRTLLPLQPHSPTATETSAVKKN